MEEFSLSDAHKNNSAIEAIATIKSRIANVKSNLYVLENLLVQSSLS